MTGSLGWGSSPSTRWRSCGRRHRPRPEPAPGPGRAQASAAPRPATVGRVHPAASHACGPPFVRLHRQARADLDLAQGGRRVPSSSWQAKGSWRCRTRTSELTRLRRATTLGWAAAGCYAAVLVALVLIFVWPTSWLARDRARRARVRPAARGGLPAPRRGASRTGTQPPPTDGESRHGGESSRGAAFIEPGRIALVEKPIPDVGPLDALLRVTTTTICESDVHILKGEYPVGKGLTIGHEPVGVVEKLGSAVHGYREGQRVIAGAITPTGQTTPPCAASARRMAPARRTAGRRSAAGSSAIRSTAVRPSMCWSPTPWPTWLRFRMDLTDEQVLMCPDIMSTGFSGAESGRDPDRRYGRGVRPRSDRPLRHCRGKAQGCHHYHRRRSVPERLQRRAGSALTMSLTTVPSRSGRRDHAS